MISIYLDCSDCVSKSGIEMMLKIVADGILLFSLSHSFCLPLFPSVLREKRRRRRQAKRERTDPTEEKQTQQNTVVMAKNKKSFPGQSCRRTSNGQRFLLKKSYITNGNVDSHLKLINFLTSEQKESCRVLLVCDCFASLSFTRRN